MVVREILMIGNPKLREISEPITDFQGEELARIKTDVVDTLAMIIQKEKIGRAMAAPQIGYMRRLICTLSRDRSFQLVNPEIIWKSDEEFDVWDSCFSFDLAFFVKITRARSIKVKYFDIEGKEVIEQFEGDYAELLQHEIDHLDGILATDHLKDNRNIILRSEFQKLLGIENIGDT